VILESRRDSLGTVGITLYKLDHFFDLFSLSPSFELLFVLLKDNNQSVTKSKTVLPLTCIDPNTMVYPSSASPDP
jgi:hypothetical protein